MSGKQLYENRSAQISGRQESIQISGYGNSLGLVEKNDAALKEDIANVLWKDDVLRALDYHDIDIRVKNGTVTFNGRITSSRSQNRVKNAIRAIPGILKINNNLVSDDDLALRVSSALGDLEHTHGCKFFTGASHGVISINGAVSNENIRLLAEKCASDTPNIRGVINNIHVPGSRREMNVLPFLQPAIGETIYFLDWVSGVVKQVVIDPNNRRVIAMIVQGKFTNQLEGPGPMIDDKALSLERLFVIPMNTVRHLTKTSGFLHVNSNERNQYMDFASAHFVAPPQNWAPPYPYCPEDVLFSGENHEKAI